MALNLRPWQESAINKCLKWFDSNQDNKFLVNAAPGAGKTIWASVIALELIKKNGFINAEYRNLSNGISAIHSGWKI